MLFSPIRQLAVTLAGATLLAAFPAYPCTTFSATHAGQTVVGKDYDWTEGAGLVVINPRGLNKTAITLAPGDAPATWTSQYASVSFDQYGVEMANGGLNERGLVVEVMWLDSTRYPAADARPAVNELQWIQYALDRFATVGELVRAAPEIRVARAYANVHYLACDASGDCAAFEYLAGDLVITQSQDMPAKTLSNDTYRDSAAYLGSFSSFGGTAAMPTTTSSLDRFARASMLARTSEGTSVPDSGFEILRSVAQASTRWSIVYQPEQRVVHFQTSTTPKVKTVALSSFALDCTAPRKVLDIDLDASGDVAARFSDYNASANRQLLTVTMAPMAARLPAGTLERVVAYPDSVTCTPGSNTGNGAQGGTPPVSAGGTAAGSLGSSGAADQTRPVTGGVSATPTYGGGPSTRAGTKDSGRGGCGLAAAGRPDAARSWCLGVMLAWLLRRRRSERPLLGKFEGSRNAR